jgi:hypothetical protein
MVSRANGAGRHALNVIDVLTRMHTAPQSAPHIRPCVRGPALRTSLPATRRSAAGPHAHESAVREASARWGRDFRVRSGPQADNLPPHRRPPTSYKTPSKTSRPGFRTRARSPIRPDRATASGARPVCRCTGSLRPMCSPRCMGISRLARTWPVSIAKPTYRPQLGPSTYHHRRLTAKVSVLLEVTC